MSPSYLDISWSAWMLLEPFFLAVTPPSLTPQSLRMYASLTPSHSLTSPSTPSHLTHKVDDAVIIDLDNGVVTCRTHDPPTLPHLPTHALDTFKTRYTNTRTYQFHFCPSLSPTQSNQLSEGIELTSLFIQVHTADEEKLFHRGNAMVIFPICYIEHCFDDWMAISESHRLVIRLSCDPISSSQILLCFWN